MVTDSFVDDNILRFLADGRWHKTREINVHMDMEYESFSRSTLSRHLNDLLRERRIERKFSPDRQHLALWRYVVQNEVWVIAPNYRPGKCCASCDSGGPIFKDLMGGAWLTCSKYGDVLPRGLCDDWEED